MPNHPKTMGQSQQSAQSPSPAPDPTTRQAGQQNMSHTNTEATNKKHPTQNGRPTQMQAPDQHKHMHTPQTIKPRPPGQPGSQADPAMHHPAHHRAQGKDTSPTSRRATKKGHSTHSKEAALPHEMQHGVDHQPQAHTTHQEPPSRQAKHTKHGGKSRHAQDHHPDTTAHKTVEDGMQ
ncbi:hypothetical protein AMECASPLE_029103 [Ameca splendens]|uniref:Uncharacterized protein n=1 Tax=Ameca splendens TaxID=208324 RepID=A0ABV1A151_9TELE